MGDDFRLPHTYVCGRPVKGATNRITADRSRVGGEPIGPSAHLHRSSSSAIVIAGGPIRFPTRGRLGGSSHVRSVRSTASVAASRDRRHPGLPPGGDAICAHLCFRSGRVTGPERERARDDRALGDARSDRSRPDPTPEPPAATPDPTPEPPAATPDPTVEPPAATPEPTDRSDDRALDRTIDRALDARWYADHRERPGGLPAGGLVTLTGTGWQPGESVHIYRQ